MEESVFRFGVGCRLLNTVPGLQVIVSLWAVCAIDRESLVGSLMTGGEVDELFSARRVVFSADCN